jgi:isopenicillin N synthase-like dioxygenase
MTGDRVPLIDISPSLGGAEAAKRRVAEEIGRACTEIGFFAIAGHGVPQALIAEFLAASHAFFGQPVAEKMKAAHPVPGTPRGYRVLAGEALGRAATPGAPPDLKEFYHIGPDTWPHDAYHTGPEGRRYFIPNLWPERPANLRSAALTYYRAMERLEQHLLRLGALSLGIAEDFFEDKIDRHVSAMRINYYPAQAEPPAEGQLRAGAHTDYGGMTILVGEDGPGGLQVRTRRGEWIDVPTRPDFFVVNIGDLLMQWTNDAWVSNLHRVVNPPPDVARTSHRISIAYFHQPNYDALIECIPTCTGPDAPARYPPVRSGDYRDRKYSDTLIVGRSADPG